MVIVAIAFVVVMIIVILGRDHNGQQKTSHSDLNKDLSHHVCPMLVLAELEFEIRLECFFCCENEFLKVGLYRTFCVKILDFFNRKISKHYMKWP